MDFRRFSKTAALATMGIVITASSAFAFTAKSSTALNVRSGPGTGYNIVDALYTGEKVNVNKCTKSRKWCYVTHSGPDGWVAAKYLKRVGGHKPKPTPTPYPSDPEITFGFQFGSGGSSFTFGFSTEDGYTTPHEPKPHKAKICFYSNAYYKGKKACVDAGTNNRLLSPKWNDRISSIKVIGDASVTVCKHKNYKGICRTIDNNIPKLGFRLNDEISSFKSYRY
ncbi:SH3 domain-containing protein [Maritalea porphyrae]|uniref:SH3 domain-containing protein n=1 Tax=Maritalea porphyrae TaxID=880732 RepID=UPI0022AF06F4|nr:SH3 domain-containing protein [Maritalea porphyrae]MCZ4274082.1 SH3 domain-containing protein [Maritalea porphyrae]